ncbi:hypothetical protein [Melittangium boletus]|uniref:Lipoprotein n=1 Tax=Melittangium boletus DSM 14713 TaxID=1294270 RepID=A0A250IPX6_9BACT|nr:hypothetical protein [Melittangium boletus]ATB33221.1 hypothetical protein MEBOL_006710 [Melittangium boletus DSM 14713]
MRHVLGTIAVGMMSLLGSSALAELPPVKKATAFFNGCDYSIQSRPFEGLAAGQSPWIYYKVVIQREQGPYCWFPPATLELLDVAYEPELAILADYQGIAVAYGWTTSSRSTGLSTRIRVGRVNPYASNAEALEITRQSTLEAYQFASSTSGPTPGSLYLDRLTFNYGNLEVRGRLTGNWVAAQESPSSGPISLLEGDHFIAIYPGIFSTTQPPLFVTY